MSEQSTSAQTLELAGQAMHVAGATIATAIDGSNLVERERLAADAATRRTQILGEILRAQASDPVAAENLRLQAQALQLVIDALRTAPPSNTVVLISAGVGLFALIGLVWVWRSEKR